MIDWGPIDQTLGVISCFAKSELAWPPMALFKAMPLSIWYGLSDFKLAEALDDRGSFRRFCGSHSIGFEGQAVAVIALAVDRPEIANLAIGDDANRAQRMLFSFSG